MIEASPSHTTLYLWRGCSLVVGPGIDSKLHSHFAMQLTVSLDQPFRARFSEQDPWTETKAATFAPNQMHQIDSAGLLAHLFVEGPQRGHGDVSALQADYVDTADFDGIRAALRYACEGKPDMEAVARLMHGWLDSAFPDSDVQSAFDPRIAQTLDWLAKQEQLDHTGEELAARVHLSTSRFTHLFRQQTGLSLTRYLLWTRLLTAVAVIAQGANTTAAAHQAGFADLAHMSRTFRQTFGVMPSELQKMTIAFKRDVPVGANIQV
jgi:AraC-like DNA-binding protein